MNEQPKSPQCEKLASVSEDSGKIGAFLDWIFGEKELYLCEFVDDRRGSRYVPLFEYHGNVGINNLLAEYFGVDLDEVERERRALLDWLREVQK